MSLITTWSAGRRALTLLELIVVITVVGALMALLVPAIQYARGAARTTVCLNHARQFGMASREFEISHNHLPTEPLISAHSPGWAIDLLPHLERAELRSRFDPVQPIDAVINVAAASSSRPDVFRCPQVDDAPIAVVDITGVTTPVLPSHYAFNGAILGLPLSRIMQSDRTLLTRDSGSSAQPWHTSPFASSFSDGSPNVHYGGTVLVFVSGRAELRSDDDLIIIDPSR